MWMIRPVWKRPPDARGGFFAVVLAIAATASLLPGSQDADHILAMSTAIIGCATL